MGVSDYVDVQCLLCLYGEHEPTANAAAVPAAIFMKLRRNATLFDILRFVFHYFYHWALKSVHFVMLNCMMDFDSLNVYRGVV